MAVARIKKRADFKRAAKHQRVSMGVLVIESYLRQDTANKLQSARVGFTVSKKCGNAVKRNRIKRRLRAGIEDTKDILDTNRDYVIIARKECFSIPYENLTDRLRRGFEKVTDAPVGAHLKRRKPFRNQS